MCLTKVTETYTKPSDLIVSGWKEFDGGMNPPFSFTQFGNTVVMDTWLKADEDKAPTGIKADDGRKYMAGFHIYTEENLKSKRSYRRVYFRRVTCLGLQGDRKCAIAQEMYVPTDPDGWPPLTSATLPPPSKPQPQPSQPPLRKTLSDRIRKSIRKP